MALAECAGYITSEWRGCVVNVADGGITANRADDFHVPEVHFGLAPVPLQDNLQIRVCRCIRFNDLVPGVLQLALQGFEQHVFYIAFGLDARGGLSESV